MPPTDDAKSGLKLKAESRGDEWILNGEKTFIANAPVGKLFFIDCALIRPYRSSKAPPCSWFRATRPASVSVKCSIRAGRFYSKRRNDF